MRKALYILGSLDDADIEWMVHRGERISLQPGDVLIRENVPIEHLFFLVEGQLSVRTGKSMDQEVATLLPGEIVGEISFVDNRNPTATVIALQASRVLGVRKVDLVPKLQRDPGFASRFYRAVAAFLADRLYVTTCRLGYGSPSQDLDADAIDEARMDEVSLAAIRFDKFLRYLADEQNKGSFAATSL